jgi:hypothetical protein
MGVPLMLLLLLRRPFLRAGFRIVPQTELIELRLCSGD